MQDWDSLSKERRIELQIAYGHYLDQLSSTCSMLEKNERFRLWLADQGIAYATGDSNQPTEQN